MVSPLWLGNVLLVSVLLLVRRTIWPVFLTAGLAGFLLYDVQEGVPIRSMVWLILSNAVEVLTAAFCLSSSFDGVPRLNSLKALVKYSFYAVFLAPFVGAFPGALSTPSNYWASWKVAFFSEALGFLTLMPAILGWAREILAWARKPPAFYLEAAAMLVALAFLAYLTFAAPGGSSPPAMLYSLVPLLLWSTLRFGATGVSTSMIAIAFISIWGLVHRRGPFHAQGSENSMLALQLFLTFAATPFMILAAVVEDRKLAAGQLASLSGRLIEAHEEERKRIARDVHDDYSQRLALLAIDVEQLTEKVGDSSEGAKQQLLDFYERISELGADMHSLSHQLHSSTLDSLGLVAGVRAFCEEFTVIEQVQVEFTHENVPRSIPGDAALCLFRVAQEGLRNVKRHSGADKANVHIEWSDGNLHLTVCDHGKGFEVGSPPVGSGIGIWSMQERLRLLGGRLQIQSYLMQGTRIDARLPLMSE